MPRILSTPKCIKRLVMEIILDEWTMVLLPALIFAKSYFFLQVLPVIITWNKIGRYRCPHKSTVTRVIFAFPAGSLQRDTVDRKHNALRDFLAARVFASANFTPSATTGESNSHSHRPITVYNFCPWALFLASVKTVFLSPFFKQTLNVPHTLSHELVQPAAHTPVTYFLQ